MSNLNNNTAIDFKRYKRFFAFGCSFTNYFWPTWADIICTEIPDSYNYGLCGSGNGYILNTVIECNQRYKFNSDDLIIIMWTSTAREDRYVGKNWRMDGNIYSQSFYPPEMVKKMSCERGYLIRDLGYMAAVTAVLESSECDYDYLSVVPLDNVDGYTNKRVSGQSDVLEIYSDILEIVRPSVFSTLFEGDWNRLRKVKQTFWSDKEIVDYHPLPVDYLNYLKLVYPDSMFDRSIDMIITQMSLIDQLPYLSNSNYKYSTSRRKTPRL